MKSIVLIGVGQLGRRYLQGITKSTIVKEVFIYDVNPDAIKASKEIIASMPDKHHTKYHFSQHLSDFPYQIDLLILVTNSVERAQIFIDVSLRHKVLNVIFEKFLFPRIDDFSLVQNVLTSQNIRAWVNCPRRIFPDYLKLKEIASGSLLKVIVAGTNWGLACNSIHFIDYISFIIGSSNYQITDDYLINSALSTKRKGYVEFYGSLEGKFQNGTSFTLTCIPGDSYSISIILITSESIILLDQQQNLCTIHSQIEGSFKSNSFPIKMSFQSEITASILESIFADGEVGLTDFETSAKLHLPLLETFLNKYRQITNNSKEKLCPIT